MSEPEPMPAPGRGARVEARRLTRRFGSRVALKDVSLTIEPGEAFGLLGANGAGKTTFIRLVTGLLLPSEGLVEVDGISPSTSPARVQSRIGFVMETSRLYPEQRVRGFLRFIAGARGLSRSEATAAVDATIAQFRLDSVATRLIGNLSKGFQQRVSLAQAFLHDPALLIVDEPTGGLDPVQQREVQEILRGLRGQRTLILCTHDLDEARKLASRVAVLREGRLIADGLSQDVLGEGESLELFRGSEEA
ncbi:MAG: ABC transporter ATP-binding protein [Myxococcota bacterium]